MTVIQSNLTNQINKLIGGKDLGKEYMDFSTNPLFKSALICDHLAFYHRDKKEHFYNFRNHDLVSYHKNYQKIFTDIKVQLFNKEKLEYQLSPNYYIIQKGIKTKYLEVERTPEEIWRHRENLELRYSDLKMRNHESARCSLEDFIEMNTEYSYIKKVTNEVKNVLFAYEIDGYKVFEFGGNINQVDLNGLKCKGEYSGVACKKEILNKRNIRQAFDIIKDKLGIDMEEIN